MAIPKQNPGRSKQDYGTPPELLRAITAKLGIRRFSLDVAADATNSVAESFYDAERDGLADGNRWLSGEGSWTWCNPPFAGISPWVHRAASEARMGAQVCVLVPASVGANWWKDWVEPRSYQLFLTPRITFVGCKDPYPKDCALLLYTPWGATGNQTWRWK